MESNHECYVSLEVAKLLKQAGFDWDSHFTCEQQQDEWQQFAFIEVSNSHYDKSIPFSSLTNIVVLPHVTLDVAQRWLREVKRFFVCVVPEIKDYHVTWIFYICNEQGFCYEYEDCFLTYEEAQEAGIKKALKIILEKGE